MAFSEYMYFKELSFKRTLSWDRSTLGLDSRDPSSSQEHGIGLKAKQQGVQDAVTSRVPDRIQYEYIMKV